MQDDKLPGFEWHQRAHFCTDTAATVPDEYYGKPMLRKHYARNSDGGVSYFDHQSGSHMFVRVKYSK